MPSEMDQRPSRSTFFWFLGSNVKGNAVEVLLNIDDAKLRKSIVRLVSFRPRVRETRRERGVENEERNRSPKIIRGSTRSTDEVNGGRGADSASLTPKILPMDKRSEGYREGSRRTKRMTMFMGERTENSKLHDLFDFF